MWERNALAATGQPAFTLLSGKRRVTLRGYSRGLLERSAVAMRGVRTSAGRAARWIGLGVGALLALTGPAAAGEGASAPSVAAPVATALPSDPGRSDPGPSDPGPSDPGPQYAREFRMAGDATRMRVVMEFDREPDLRWFLLASPPRLVFEMKQTRLAFDPTGVQARGLVAGVRYGASADEGARLVLATKGAVTVEGVEVKANETAPGYRMVADLVAASDKEFRDALAEQAQATGAVAPPHAASEAPKRFHIVLDAGHGGFDGGAHGVATGTPEKTITLTFALELRARLAALNRFDVSMTRDTDVFLPLDERVAVARHDGADLLISIHADTIDVPELHGATVYTVSDKASDPAAEAVAVRENLSDQLAGIKAPDASQQVADILVDLIRRETHGISVRFARSLVEEFSRGIGMIKNPHRAAGFRVLRAPDVPSVLIELGYLSNAADEQKLLDPAWRAQAIDGIARSVERFAGADASAAAQP